MLSEYWLNESAERLILSVDRVYFWIIICTISESICVGRGGGRGTVCGRRDNSLSAFCMTGTSIFIVIEPIWKRLSRSSLIINLNSITKPCPLAVLSCPHKATCGVTSDFDLFFVLVSSHITRCYLLSVQLIIWMDIFCL